MPRPRKEGPRWIGDSWYVQVMDGTKRRSLSLRTESYELACQRYAAGLKALLDRIRKEHRASAKALHSNDSWLPTEPAVVFDQQQDGSFVERETTWAEIGDETNTRQLSWDDLADNAEEVSRRKTGKGKSNSWWSNYRAGVKHLKFSPGEATVEKVRAYIDSELQRRDPRNGKPISPVTVDNRCCLWQGLIKTAIRSGYAPHLSNPFLDVDFTTQIENSYYTPTKADYLWMGELLRDQPENVQVAVKVLMSSGCRVNALSYLSKQTEPGWVELPDVDGTKGGGRFPLPFELWSQAKALNRMPTAKKLNELLKGREIDGFANHSWRHGFKRLCREVGVDDNTSKALMCQALPGMDATYGNGYGDKPLVEAASKVWAQIEEWTTSAKPES